MALLSVFYRFFVIFGGLGQVLGPVFYCLLWVFYVSSTVFYDFSGVFYLGVGFGVDGWAIFLISNIHLSVGVQSVPVMGA